MICKLCEREKELKSSHVIPRFLYRYMLNVTDGYLTQYHSYLNLWQKSNRQLKKELFCFECEQLLSKNELAFSEIFKQINESSESEKAVFSYAVLDDSEINKLEQKGYDQKSIDAFLKSNPIYDKIHILEYFAISYIYRELLNNSYTIPESEKRLLQNYLLNGSTCSFMLHVRLHNSQPSFNLISTATVFDALDDWKHYTFYVPNMQFHVALRVGGTPEDMSKTIVMPSNFFDDDLGSIEMIRNTQSGSRKSANLNQT